MIYFLPISETNFSLCSCVGNAYHFSNSSGLGCLYGSKCRRGHVTLIKKPDTIASNASCPFYNFQKNRIKGNPCISFIEMKITLIIHRMYTLSFAFCSISVSNYLCHTLLTQKKIIWPIIFLILKSPFLPDFYISTNYRRKCWNFQNFIRYFKQCHSSLTLNRSP